VPANLAPGSQFGDFRIVAELGSGGMGTVYEAVDRAGRSVALKLLKDTDADPEALERFVREGRAAASVAHPNVAQVHAAGAIGSVPFIAFELLRGGSLEKRVRFGRLDWREAAALGAQVARGLDAIHRAGLVHRDLKPANVLLDEDGRVKVADLGLARLGRGLASRALTKTGEVLGTPYYMAPEQVDRAKSVDARADVYSLGATLFELLTGRPPFEANQLQKLLYQVLSVRPKSPRELAPEVPVRLEQLVLRCLEKEVFLRPATAVEVATELEAIVQEGDRGPRRSPLRLGLLGGAPGLLTVAVVSWVWLHFRAVPEKVPEKAPAATPTPTVVLPKVNVDDLERSARSAYERHAFADAIAIATSGLALDARRESLYLLRAEACEYRDHEGALADVDRALELKPRHAHAWALKAAIRSDTRKFDDAIACATSALALDRKCALAYVVRGEAKFYLESRDDWPKAVDDFRADLDAAANLGPPPRYYTALACEAVVDERDGRGDKTHRRKLAEGAKENDPANPQAFFVYAAVVADIEKRPISLDEANEALARDPHHGASLTARSECYYARRDFPQALADAEEAARCAPDSPDSWAALGDALAASGQLDRAIGAFESAIAQLPKASPPRPFLGKAWNQIALGRFKDAVETCAQGLDHAKGGKLSSGDNPQLEFCRAHAYELMGDRESARLWYERALAPDPDGNERLDPVGRINAHRYLEGLDAQAGDWKSALGHTLEELKLNENNAGFWCARAYYEGQLGRLEDCKTSAERGLDLDDKFAALHLARACALKGLGRSSESVVEFKKALEIPKDGECLKPEEDDYARKQLVELGEK
jgi:tetratricopeptide (TPR) repeat protein